MKPARSGAPAASSLLAAVAAAVLLAACGTTPRPSGRDGPGANPPPDLLAVPDAEPRIEPIRRGGPNKPYEVFGRDYVPLTGDAAHAERGLASWYGRKFHGRPTASGEPYDMYAMTAAHKTMPIPSYARVRNPANGREVIVRVNDRGPFVAGRVIDLSYTAALKLDLLRGVAPVEVERITLAEIRAGSWRRGDPAPPTALAAAPAANAPVRDPEVGMVTIDADAIAAIAARLPRDGAVPAEVAPAVQPPPVQPPAAAADEPLRIAAPIAQQPRGFWVQLGAFRERDGAEGFARHVGAELDWLAPQLALFSDESLWRLQAGPYPSRDDARASAERIRDALQLVPVVVERR